MNRQSIEGPAAGRPRSRAWGRLVDASPVIARELLITARTPAYVASIVAAPLLLGALVLLVRLGVGERLDPFAGRRIFPSYFIGLALVVGAVGATLGSNVIVQERASGTLEALRFSALGPRRVVLGKLGAVVLAEASVAVCTLPLLAFILSLGGVSIAEASVALAIALACGVMTASIGIAVSARVTHARRSQVVSLFVSGLLGVGVVLWQIGISDFIPWVGAFGLATPLGGRGHAGDALALLGILPLWGFLSVVGLGVAVASSGLMDHTEDRGLPVKRWAAVASVTGVAALACCAGLESDRLRPVLAVAAVLVVTSAAIALLVEFVGEPLRPTRRMQAEAQSWAQRVLAPRCLAPSILLVLVVVGVDLLAAAETWGSRQVVSDAFWLWSFLGTFGGLVGVVAARRGALVARVCAGVGLLGFILAVAFLRDGWRGPTWVDGLCPMWVANEEGPRAAAVLASGLTGWALAAVASVAAMFGVARASAER